MKQLRIKHTRRKGHGWFAGIDSGYWVGHDVRSNHTMCYHDFRQFFKVPASAREMELVIARRDDSGGQAQKVRILRYTLYRSRVEYWNDGRKVPKWEHCPLTGQSINFLTARMAGEWKDIYNTYYVWVEVA